MVRTLLLSAVYFVNLSLASAATDLALSALERYASSAVKASQEGALLNSQEDFEASAYDLYLRGFFAGVSASQMIYDKKEEDHKLTGDVSSIPLWMNDSSRSAPSFLAFVRRHCPSSSDKGKTSAGNVLHAWYVFEHPKAQMGERLGGLIVLTDVCKWGEDFPDAEILKKKLTENFVESSADEVKSVDQASAVSGHKLVLDGATIDVPTLQGLWRLDGRMPELDAAVQKMAVAGNNRVLLLLGAETDHMAISEGRFPSLERTLTIQQSMHMNSLMTLIDFESMRDELVKTLSSKSIPNSKFLFDQIGQAASEALQNLTESSAKAALGKPQFLGVFEENDLSFCHSMLVPGVLKVADKETNITQATSVAVVYVNGLVLSVHANAKYTEASDLVWTMRQVKILRDKLLNR